MFREPGKYPGLSLLGEQGLSSAGSLDLPFSLTPAPSLCPRPAPHGACLCICACVCDGEPPCTPIVCLSEFVYYPGQDGHSLEPWGPGAEIGRALSIGWASAHPACETHWTQGGSQVFKKVSPLTGTHWSGRWGQGHRSC